MGVNVCQGIPWNEELNGKELHGALVGECDLSWKDPPFPGHQHGVNLPFNIYYNRGIMLILKGLYIVLVPLQCSTVIPQMICPFSRVRFHIFGYVVFGKKLRHLIRA